jgi:MFS family permease
LVIETATQRNGDGTVIGDRPGSQSASAAGAPPQSGEPGETSGIHAGTSASRGGAAPAHPASGGATGSRIHGTGFWLIAAAFWIAMAFSGAPAPLYPLYEKRDGFEAFTVTVVFAVYAIGVLASLLLAGHISDWLGRRRILAAAFALQILAAVIFLAWPALPGLLIARFATGLGIGMISPTATAQLHELHAAHRPQAGPARFAIVSATANVGGLGLGPLITGMLAQYLPLPLAIPFIVFAALLTLSLAAVILSPETVDIPADRPRYRPQKISTGHGGMAAYVAAATGTVTGAAVFALFISLAPGFMAQTLHHPSRALAGVIVFVVFLSGTLAQVLTGRLPARATTAIGIVLQAAGVILLAVSLRHPGLAMFSVGGALAVAGGGLLFKTGVGTVAALAPPARRGEALAGLYFIAYVGLAVPTLAMGIGTQHFGAATSMFWFAGLLLVLLAMIAAIHCGLTRRP